MMEKTKDSGPGGTSYGTLGWGTILCGFDVYYITISGVGQGNELFPRHHLDQFSGFIC